MCGCDDYLQAKSRKVLGIDDPYSTQLVQGVGTQQRVTADK